MKRIWTLFLALVLAGGLLAEDAPAGSIDFMYLNLDKFVFGRPTMSGQMSMAAAEKIILLNLENANYSVAVALNTDNLSSDKISVIRNMLTPWLLNLGAREVHFRSSVTGNPMGAPVKTAVPARAEKTVPAKAETPVKAEPAKPAPTEEVIISKPAEPVKLQPLAKPAAPEAKPEVKTAAPEIKPETKAAPAVKEEAKPEVKTAASAVQSQLNKTEAAPAAKPAPAESAEAKKETKPEPAPAPIKLNPVELPAIPAVDDAAPAKAETLPAPAILPADLPEAPLEPLKTTPAAK